MVVITPEIFNPDCVVVKRVIQKGKQGEVPKIKVRYLVKDKEEKIELDNSVGIISAATCNGLNPETNFTTKKPTGNYKPGFQLVQDMSNKTEKEKKLLEFYDKFYQAVKDAMKKNKEVCSNPVLAETLEHFVKYPAKRENGKPKPGEYNYEKSPSIWAKPYYKTPDNIPKESLTSDDIQPSLIIKDGLGKDVSCKELEDKLFKAFYKMELYGIEQNPNSGGKVLSWRVTEMKVKVIGEANKGGRQATINAEFDD